MKLRNLRVGIENVTRPIKGDKFECIEVSTNRVRTEGGSFGRDVESYSLHCIANRGDIIKIKVPASLSGKVSELTSQFGDDVSVLVKFDNLKIIPYAMYGTGNSFYSGVSGKADDFHFEVVEQSVDF